MSKINPRTCYSWAIRVLAAAGPITLGMLVAWGVWPELLRGRQNLFMMVYMLVLLVASSAVSVAVLAGCHVAIHKAFSVGYQTAKRERQPEAPPRLTVVE